jgi:nucleoside transporter
MMFLQFYIWGSWYVTMGTYLNQIGFQGGDIGRAYSTTGWGAIIAPFFIGMIADRFFSAQKVMGVLHLLGAGIMYYASSITDPVMFFWVVLCYTICYMPTLALVNAISFNQMQSSEKEFSQIRVLGTLGWIAAGLVVGIITIGGANIEDTHYPMWIASGVSLVLGIYSFTLPSTPPKSVGNKVTIGDVLGLDALKLMKDRSFAVLIVCSLLVCIPLTFYYNFTNLFLNESGMENPAAKMTLGQMSEVFFLLVMPFFFVRLGVKKMILVGMAAWVIRYALFAYGNNDALVWMFYGGIILHGVCFDFFFVTGQIYVDQAAPEKVRASAQGLIALVTYGIGMVIGSYVSGYIVQLFETKNDAGVVVGHAWQSVWLIPCAMAVVVMILFAALFKDKPASEKIPIDNEA